MKKEDLWESHCRLVWKIVWGFDQNTPSHITEDDLFSEAQMAFVLAAEDWNHRGSFAGFLYARVHWRLQSYVRQACRKAEKVGLCDEVPDREERPPSIWDQQWGWDSVSPDAELVMLLAIRCHWRHRSRSSACRRICRELRCSEDYAEQVFDEISCFLLER